MIAAEVIADSISSVSGVRLTTMALCYPKYIHGELMTHRQFSRNARSSRAVPVERILKEVETDPVLPLEWGENQRGMQAGEALGEAMRMNAERIWRQAAADTARACRAMADAGLHKQWANRPLEPFTYIFTLVTSCFWRNFYQLRRHPDAQPEMRALADTMWAAHAASKPAPLSPGQWHLPYVNTSDADTVRALMPDADVAEVLRRVSTARCARVSYRTFENRQPLLEEDLGLYERLMGAQPLHASPSEHQATPDESGSLHQPRLWGNFYTWIQHRKMLSGEDGGTLDCGISGVL